jgi:ribonuclease P protein component
LSERHYRLTGVGAFEAVFRQGRRLDGRYVQLIAAPAQSLPGRAGFVVARKVLRRAIDRNRFKRRVRQFLRESRSGIEGMDVIVRLARPLRRDQIDIAATEAGELLLRLAGTEDRP